MIKKVILVYKTHFDYGFTDLAENVLQQYAGNMLTDVIKACEETSGMGKLGLVWSMSAMPLYEMLRRNDGERLRHLEKLIQQDRIKWHTLPFTSHFDFCGMEEFIEGMRYARELSQRFGKPYPISAKMTDVPGHGKMLPSLLAAAGVRFLHIGTNEFPITPNVPPIFFWEGPDGARVLTIYSRGYGSSVMPPEDWPLPVWIAFLHTPDNAGPPSTQEIQDIVDKVKGSHPYAEVSSGSLDDFYYAAAPYLADNIPIVNTDLADSWIHGIGSYPQEVSAVRNIRRKALTLSVTSALTCPETSQIRRYISEAYRRLALFGEHTWGMDVKTWLPASQRLYEKEVFTAALQTPPYIRMESSWQEQRNHVLEAEKLLNKAEELLAKSNEKNEKKKCIVNPNGEPFTGWVLSPQNIDAMPLFGSTYTFAENVLPLSIIELQAETISSFSLSEPTVCGDLVSVENHRYCITFCSESGIIHSVFDKKINKPLLQTQSDAGVFGYQYNVYGSESLIKYLTDYCRTPSYWGYQDNGRESYPACESVTYTPVFQSWEIKGATLILRHCGSQARRFGDCQTLETHITLPPKGDELFVELRLNHKQATPFIESGSFTLPFAHANPQILLNKNGNIIDPQSDIATGANHAFYCLESFAAMQTDDVGLCVVTHDTPLMAIGETGVHTFRETYEKHEPTMFFNLFNNMWGTNFPQWISGDFCYRFTLFGYTPGERIYGRALSLYQGVYAISGDTALSNIVLPKQVQIMAFCGDDNGGILRIRDVSGQSRQVEFATTDNSGTLRRTDLFGEAMENSASQRLSVSLAPYGICTISYTRS